MTAAYTPGPWVIGGNNSFPWAIASAKTGALVANAFGPHAEGLGRGETELEANARLIAAAPDLMKALCFLMLPSTEKALREAGFKTECDKARAAITKAEELKS